MTAAARKYAAWRGRGGRALGKLATDMVRSRWLVGLEVPRCAYFQIFGSTEVVPCLHARKLFCDEVITYGADPASRGRVARPGDDHAGARRPAADRDRPPGRSGRRDPLHRALRT